MAQHRKYSPSATDRWLACPGSIELSDGLESPDSDYSEEGSLAHSVGELAVINHEEPSCEDPEMERYVKVYTDHVKMIRDTYRDSSPEWAEWIETTFDSVSIEGLGGTPDYVALYNEGDDLVLHISDFKYGAGVLVPVIRNPQLLTYCVVLDECLGGRPTKFRITVVQPRVFDKPQTWDVPTEDLLVHRESILQALGKSNLVAGDHCRWCPAIGICPQVKAHAAEAAQAEFTEVLSGEEAAKWMKLAPAIRKFLTHVEDTALTLLVRGQKVPGYKTTRSLGKRRWALDTTALLKTLAKAGIPKKIATRVEVLSPAQLEKQGVDKGLIKSLVERPLGGYRLVPESSQEESTNNVTTDFDE